MEKLNDNVNKQIMVKIQNNNQKTNISIYQFSDIPEAYLLTNETKINKLEKSFNPGCYYFNKEDIDSIAFTRIKNIISNIVGIDYSSEELFEKFIRTDLFKHIRTVKKERRKDGS